MKALVTAKFSDKEMKSFEDLGYEVLYIDERNITFSSEIEDTDILISSFIFDKIDIDLLRNLKWIQLLTVGINQVPMDKVRNKSISLTNNKGAYSIPISEWIVLKMLEMVKNSKDFYDKQRKKQWKMDTSLLELYGKTVGFIGAGSIATEAAKRLEAFGLNIIGINSSGRDVEHFHKTYSIDKINEVVPSCDFIVVTSPYTKKTHHLIDESALSSMKDGAYFINIARGPIVDEKSLINNLKSGKIKKAALDVFEEEPLSHDSPLWEMDNVIISPHNSWSSEMYGKRRYETTYNNLKRYIKGEELINLVDLDKGY